ncbi:hypothetical protein BJV78DRAFT_888661 [Lactifluus subvellereus]|nr:hypothetical protein BJV78DRAFT_888661 [Lactifluus subvellereus]
MSTAHPPVLPIVATLPRLLSTSHRHHRAQLVNTYVIPLRLPFWLAHYLVEYCDLPGRSIRTRIVTIMNGTDEVIIFCESWRRFSGSSLLFRHLGSSVPRVTRLRRLRRVGVREGTSGGTLSVYLRGWGSFAYHRLGEAVTAVGPWRWEPAPLPCSRTSWWLHTSSSTRTGLVHDKAASSCVR